MSVEECLLEGGLLTVELLVTCWLYKTYKTKKSCLISLLEVKSLELDSELQKQVEENSGVIKYAAISGAIKALNQPLRSQFVPHLRGVIRQRITKEHKVKWNPLAKMWSSVNHYLQYTSQAVPFALCNRSAGLFKKQVTVEISEPLRGSELAVPTVYDEFTSHQDTIGDAVVGFFRGERTIGIQEIEKMLCESDQLTVVGKLVLEKNGLTMKPPDSQLTYFVTPRSLESLTDEVRGSMESYRLGTIVIGTLTAAVAIHLALKVYGEVKRRIDRRKEMKKVEEQMRLRRLADETRGAQNPNLPKCVVCLEFPVELFILECGHACLCYSCVEHVNRLCPLCREPITRTVPAFWP